MKRGKALKTDISLGTISWFSIKEQLSEIFSVFKTFQGKLIHGSENIPLGKKIPLRHFVSIDDLQESPIEGRSSRLLIYDLRQDYSL